MKHKQGGLSLERFAKAKQSGYDKKAKKAKELALNAKKINKYRKLKQKLAATGLLAPRFTYEQQEEDHERFDAQPRRPSNEKIAGDRIRARAGPAPDSAGECEGDDMIGSESESDSDNEALTHSEQIEQPQSQPQHQLEHRRQQALAPQGKTMKQQSTDTCNTPSNANDRSKEKPQHDASAPGRKHDTRDRAGNNIEDINFEHDREPEQEHERGHKVRGLLGRKQKRSKKGKPESQLQRMQAEVRAKKEAEQRQREERRKHIEEYAIKVAEAEKRRKQHTKLLRKQTNQGQPVMRYRMDKILGQLQAEAAQS